MVIWAYCYNITIKTAAFEAKATPFYNYCLPLFRSIAKSACAVRYGGRNGL